MLNVVDPAWVDLLFMQDLSGHRSVVLGSHDLSTIWFWGVCSWAFSANRVAFWCNVHKIPGKFQYFGCIMHKILGKFSALGVLCTKSLRNSSIETE